MEKYRRTIELSPKVGDELNTLLELHHLSGNELISDAIVNFLNDTEKVQELIKKTENRKNKPRQESVLNWANDFADNNKLETILKLSEEFFIIDKFGYVKSIHQATATAQVPRQTICNLYNYLKSLNILGLTATGKRTLLLTTREKAIEIITEDKKRRDNG
jgi:hypothetical protein